MRCALDYDSPVPPVAASALAASIFLLLRRGKAMTVMIAIQTPVRRNGKRRPRREGRIRGAMRRPRANMR